LDQLEAEDLEQRDKIGDLEREIEKLDGEEGFHLFRWKQAQYGCNLALWYALGRAKLLPLEDVSDESQEVQDARTSGDQDSQSGSLIEDDRSDAVGFEEHKQQVAQRLANRIRELEHLQDLWWSRKDPRRDQYTRELRAWAKERSSPGPEAEQQFVSQWLQKDRE
jgi:hypothetical protein